MPDGNAKEDGKVMWSQSQYAPRLFQAVIEVKVEGEGEQRLSGSVCWGGGDIIGRGRPIIIGGGVFVGAGSPSMSMGGSFVVDGESPSTITGGSFVVVGESPSISGGGSFVEAGVSPSIIAGGSFVVAGASPSMPDGGSFVEDGCFVPAKAVKTATPSTTTTQPTGPGRNIFAM